MNAEPERVDPQLHAAIPAVGEPDLLDLHARLRARGSGHKRQALLTGGALAVAIVLLMASAYVSRESRTPPTGSHGSIDDVSPLSAESVPNGAWLINGGTSADLVAADGRELNVDGVRLYDISPDGAAVAGTTVEQVRYDGDQSDGVGPSLTLQTQLLVVDAATGASRVVAEAAANGTLVGPIAWSSDGSKIAYRQTTWSVDPLKENPLDRVVSELVCIAAESGKEPICLDSTEGALSFDWSPTGTEIIWESAQKGVAVVGTESGVSTPVVGQGGTDSVRSLLESEGWGDLLALNSPRWSPSGRYFAGLAQTSQAGSVPLILDFAGKVVASGIPNGDAQVMAWNPSEDKVAYTTGVQIAPDPDGNFTVQLLGPTSSDSEQLVRFDGPNAYITTLIWSPDGSTLAVGGSEAENHDVVTLVDIKTKAVLDRVTVASEIPDSLADWGPAA